MKVDDRSPFGPPDEFDRPVNLVRCRRGGLPGRVQQVLWNLLTNAVKFTPTNGLVPVVPRRTESHLEIGVTGNGEGIGPDEHRRSPRAETPDEKPDGPSADIGGIRVLVVDDEPDARTVVCRFLEHRGPTVATASTADEAVNLIAASRFDLLGDGRLNGGFRNNPRLC